LESSEHKLFLIYLQI